LTRLPWGYEVGPAVDWPSSEHPDEVAGMVYVETGAPFRNPFRVIVEETDPNHPSNLERR
jgi:hypothetical protein